MKEDGSSELYLALDGGRPELLQFQGDIMLIDGNRFDGPVLYDMAKEEFIEDEVLTEGCSLSGGRKRIVPPCNRRKRDGADYRRKSLQFRESFL